MRISVRARVRACVHPPVGLSVRPSVRASARPSARPSVRLSVCGCGCYLFVWERCASALCRVSAHGCPMGACPRASRACAYALASRCFANTGQAKKALSQNCVFLQVAWATRRLTNAQRAVKDATRLKLTDCQWRPPTAEPRTNAAVTTKAAPANRTTTAP